MLATKAHPLTSRKKQPDEQWIPGIIRSTRKHPNTRILFEHNDTELTLDAIANEHTKTHLSGCATTSPSDGPGPDRRPKAVI